MRSGLRSQFSRPRRTYGATANTSAWQTPQEKNAYFSSPAVSDKLGRGFIRTPNPHFVTYTQVHSSRHRRPASPASQQSRYSTSRPGGRHRNSGHQALNPLEKERNFPVPCDTLQTRLSLNNLEVERFREKEKGRSQQLPKSVDQTAEKYKSRFSGLPGEDWVGHIDSFDTHRANKFLWSARSFYYGLLHTLAGEALETATAMEEDNEEFELTEMLSDWFECEMAELRSMISGKLKYPQLHPRTKCAVLITYFEDKFQADTADSAELKFRFANQRP